MNANHMPLVFAVLIALAGVAAAEEQHDIDTITASRGGLDEHAWNLTLDDLTREYPAIARAVQQLDRLVEVSDHEQDSTRAYFAELNRRGVTLIEVDGARYAVAISIAGGGLPPASGEGEGEGLGEGEGTTTHVSDQSDAKDAVPAAGALLVVGAVAGAAALVHLVRRS